MLVFLYIPCTRANPYTLFPFNEILLCIHRKRYCCVGKFNHHICSKIWKQFYRVFWGQIGQRNRKTFDGVEHLNYVIKQILQRSLHEWMTTLGSIPTSSFSFKILIRYNWFKCTYRIFEHSPLYNKITLPIQKKKIEVLIDYLYRTKFYLKQERERRWNNMTIWFWWCFAWELDLLVFARLPSQISYRNDLGQKRKTMQTLFILDID